MPVIDLSAPRIPAAASPRGRRRRRTTAFAVVALAAVCTGAAGFAALRPAPSLTAPEAVPEPSAAASADSGTRRSLLGRAGIPPSAADPAHISPAPRS